jgi:hypothetical protein
MCAIVSAIVKPLNVALIVSVWAVAVTSSTTVATPVPGELLGGLSFAPLRLATKVVVAASAAGADCIISALPKLIPKTKTRDFMTTPPTQNIRSFTNTQSEAVKGQPHFYFLDRVSNID